MSCTTAVPRLAYMYANLTWWCHGPSLASTDLNRLHGLHAAKTSKHVWRWSMWRYLSLQRMWGGLSRELLHTRKLHRELPREQANHMISCELVNAIELWHNEPCTPQLLVKQLSKTIGCLTRDPTKTKNQDTIQKESPTSPGASFMKIVLANK